MKASGNGNPETCAKNLIQIVRGEVPYDRIKGIDGTLVDKPNAKDEMVADMEWVLDVYEPRIKADGSVTVLEDGEGNFNTVLDISLADEEEEE